MKSSAIALLTATALMFGAGSATFAQDTTPTTAPASAAECAAIADSISTDENDGSAVTPTDESLVNQQADDASGSTALGTTTSGDNANAAVDDTTPPDCPGLPTPPATN